MADNLDRELDWDEIELDGKEERIEIPNGDYDFTVDHFERAKTGENSKVPGTNMAVVYCVIHTEGNPMIRANLVLTERMQWKLKEFFVSIGMIKAGAESKTRISWNDIAGRRGRCRIVQKENYNDKTKTHAEIDRFLKPEEGKKWGSGF